jgi:asparagine N-glycosylation enzyme membrane subunit Stt3
MNDPTVGLIFMVLLSLFLIWACLVWIPAVLSVAIEFVFDLLRRLSRRNH